MGIKELFDTDWCVFYEWVGDQAPTLTSHYFCTIASDKKEVLAKFKKHVRPAKIFDESSVWAESVRDESAAGQIWIDAIAAMPYDPKKFAPADVTKVIASENDLDEEVAFRIHAHLLQNNPGELEALPPVGNEGWTIPVPSPEAVDEAREAIYGAKQCVAAAGVACRDNCPDKNKCAPQKKSGHIWLE